VVCAWLEPDGFEVGVDQVDELAHGLKIVALAHVVEVEPHVPGTILDRIE
jgi:hypothetical protein